jgi:hypothetical protein
VTRQADAARRFVELHSSETPLLLPNPWDLGSAKLLAWLGFKALIASTARGERMRLTSYDRLFPSQDLLPPAASAT